MVGVTWVSWGQPCDNCCPVALDEHTLTKLEGWYHAFVWHLSAALLPSKQHSRPCRQGSLRAGHGATRECGVLGKRPHPYAYAYAYDYALSA
jgi:hypothetical protein